MDRSSVWIPSWSLPISSVWAGWNCYIPVSQILLYIFINIMKMTSWKDWSITIIRTIIIKSFTGSARRIMARDSGPFCQMLTVLSRNVTAAMTVCRNTSFLSVHFQNRWSEKMMPCAWKQKKMAVWILPCCKTLLIRKPFTVKKRENSIGAMFQT